MQLFLNKLQVTNFRNLNNDIVSFSNGINCIFGQNGNGKTNLLEAIFYLTNRKSFRKNTAFQQLISIECEKPEILFSSMIISEDEGPISYSGKVERDGATWFQNNQPSKKKLALKTVFINPFDSYHFHTTPAFRRNWVDHHLSMLSPIYKKTLSQYNSSLRFRNNLLSKTPAMFREQIKANEENFSKLAYNLIQMRKEFLIELKDYCQKTFKIIFDEVHELELELESKFLNSTQQEILEYYQNGLEKDVIIGHTRTGVHRDDYTFNFDGFNSYEFCSLGQQKMSFLSLLFAYIELFRYKFISYPMVLIDDVSGELDGQRWKNLISYLQAKKFQVLITTANENFKMELEKIEEAQKIFIHDGSIKEI